MQLQRRQRNTNDLQLNTTLYSAIEESMGEKDPNAEIAVIHLLDNYNDIMIASQMKKHQLNMKSGSIIRKLAKVPGQKTRENQIRLKASTQISDT